MGILGLNRDVMMRMGVVNNDFMHGTKKGQVENNYGNTEDEDCV